MDKYDDVVIADLSAQVARLEAEATPLLAALRARQWQSGPDGDAYCMDCLRDECAGHRDDCSLAAALSSDAGKDWLSPEKKKPAIDILTDILEHATPAGNGTFRVRRGTLERAGIALDALEGVE